MKQQFEPTKAQQEAIAIGGLDQACLDTHGDRVCPHCGACQVCASGCQCDDIDTDDCDCGGCVPAGVSIGRDEQDAIRFLQSSGYAQRCGWVRPEDKHLMWTYSKPFPLTVGVWAEVMA
jgi:hypothetical protein